MTYPPQSTFDRKDDWAKRAFLIKQQSLLEGLRGRLGALAHAAGKSELAIQMAIAGIFQELGSEQDKLRPTRPERLDEIRNWKMGKGVHSSPLGDDFVPSLVRETRLQRGIGYRKRSKSKAIEGSIGVTYESLTAIEKRAVDIVLGKRRVARNKVSDTASRIAKAIQDEWLTPIPTVKITDPRTLSVRTIVRIALPFIEEIAGGPVRGGTPKDDNDPSVMDPPAVGALVAIVLMAHKSTTAEYISDLIAELMSSA
jgi:hypothetical protein